MNSKLPRLDHRLITERIIVRGILILDTPTCLGGNDTDDIVDLPLLQDNISNCSLLTGSSIAGALRNYLHELNKGYEEHDERHSLAARLFGDLSLYENEKNLSEADRQRLQDSSKQSPLIVNDSISTTVPAIELRDSVKIDGKTGTAADEAKYDTELLAEGTKFPLFFELLIDDKRKAQDLKKTLTIALQGLEKGEISIGMKKRRGFGRCHVEQWQVWQFDLENADERLAWLTYDHWTPGLLAGYLVHSSITTALDVQLNGKEDKRDRLTISTTFKLASPILIRSGQADTKTAPDVVHLKSCRSGELKPVVSGTSLAGVLRHRAERIVRTLDKPTSIVEEMFGTDRSNSKDKKTQLKASRLVVHESVIDNATGQNELVQTRIAIDRFTGGAYPGALFQEQPIFPGNDTYLKIELELRKPELYEIGLLLLLLKDLWTEDLPVGGSSSIGRGRLKGETATIDWHCSTSMQWEIKQEGEKLTVSGSRGTESSVEQQLQKFVNEIRNYVVQEEKQ